VVLKNILETRRNLEKGTKISNPEDNEKMPEFPIGQSGAIDFKFIKKKVLISINILSSKNVIHDIYRHTFIKYNDSMLEDFLNLSLEITNIYSRLVIG